MKISTAIELYHSGTLPEDLITLMEMNQAIIKASVEHKHRIYAINYGDAHSLADITEEIKLYNQMADAIMAKTFSINY